MSERSPKPTELPNEAIPSLEEIRFALERFTWGKEVTETRKLEDELGVYLWDITIPDVDGGIIEYSYVRKGPHAKGNPIETMINDTFYDKDGFPIHGSSVARYANGEWKFTP